MRAAATGRLPPAHAISTPQAGTGANYICSRRLPNRSRSGRAGPRWRGSARYRRVRSVAGIECTRRAKALHQLNAHVRSVGEPLPVDALDESDLILPNGDASVEEVYTWLTDEGEGLVPDAD